MKYLVYIVSFIFVLAFVGCNKAKDTLPDVKESTTEAVDSVKNTVKEHKCGEGKCGEGKCGGNESKEAVKEVTDN